DVDALGQPHLLGHHALRLLHEADDVAVAADVQRDVVAQPAVLALDHRRPRGDADVGRPGEGDLPRPPRGRRPWGCPGTWRPGHAAFRRARARQPSLAALAAAADQQALDGLLVLAEVAGVADAHREAVAARDRVGDDPAAQGDLDRVLDVADTHPVAGCL